MGFYWEKEQQVQLTFRTLIDLIIAVTLVYAIDAFGKMVTGEEGCFKLYLSLHMSRDGCAFWHYVVPVLAVFLHTTQLAHYHQKRESWGIGERIGRAIEGIWEVFQILAIAISIAALILINHLLPKDCEDRSLILLFWGIAYLGYGVGDLLTRINATFRTLPTEFKEAVNWLLWSDLILCFSAAVLWFFCVARWGHLNVVTAFSMLVIVSYCANYWRAKSFLLYEQCEEGQA